MGKKLSIPKPLSYKEWDKQKGIIAKIVKKKTGITEALKDFEKTYDNWGWGRVDDSSLVNYFAALKTPSSGSAAELKIALKDCQNKETYLGKVQEKLNAVKKLADTNAAEFKKSPLIPNSARSFLDTMSKACGTFVGEVRTAIADSEKKIGEELKKAGVK